MAKSIYYVVLTKTTSSALHYNKLSKRSKRFIAVVDQLWQGDVYLDQSNDIDKAINISDKILA